MTPGERKLAQRVLSPPQTVGSNVITPLAQNLVGALGVAVLVAGVGVLFVPLSALAVPAAIVAAIVFGLASTVRMFSDEVGALVHLYARYRNNNEISALQLRIRILEHELEGREANREDFNVAVDALSIAHDYYRNGLPHTQLACQDRGISRDRWDSATDMLVAAGVLQTGKRDMALPDFEHAQSAVERYTGRLFFRFNGNFRER